MTMLAGLGKLLGRGYQALAPKTALGALGEYGPDVGFSILAGMSADPGYKLGAGAEDLALGLGGSLLGRIGGRFAGQRFMGLRGDDLAGPMNMGSMIVSAPASIFGPRPFMESMFRERERDAQGPGQPPAAPTELGHITGLPAPTAADIMRNQLINSILMGTGVGFSALDAQRAGGILT